MPRRMRTVTPLKPTELELRGGLAYSLWIPDHGAELKGGVVILHGAGSRKENHHDFARACVAAGLAAVAFDQRGHGSSRGPMDDRALDDVVEITALMRERTGRRNLPVALRGSSMGGYLAILAAPGAEARAVVAVCPASADGLRRALAAGRHGFDADRESLDAFLASHDLFAAVESLTAPLLLLHAEGDEQVPVEHSRELAGRASIPGSRLIAVPGGHHRSVQHDPELRAVTLRWLDQALRPPAQ